jgi:hypothetical protein
MNQTSYLVHFSFNENSKLIEKKETELESQLKNFERTQNNTNKDSFEGNGLNIGILAPEGMKWDQYGNPELIEN